MNNFNNDTYMSQNSPDQEERKDENNINKQNNTANDAMLLNAFIGSNYENITKQPFNIAGFAFTSFYMFYRKMFNYALLTFLLYFIILNITKSFLLLLVFHIIFGLIINKIYIFYAKQQIAIIKSANPQKNIFELKSICATKGGTDIGHLGLGVVLEIIIGAIILLILSVFGLSSIINNPSDSENEVPVETNTNNTFNGTLEYDTSIKINELFNIATPSFFENNSTEYEFNYTYYESDDELNECKLTLNCPKGFSSASSLINQMNIYNSSNSSTDIKKTEINNIKWYWFSTSDSSETVYYYTTTNNKKICLLTYAIQENAPVDCESYRQQILKSITSK